MRAMSFAVGLRGFDPLRNFYDMQSKTSTFKYTPPILADKDKLI